MEERYRKNIYCEWKFIEEYLSQNLNLPLSPENIGNIMLFVNLRRLVLSPYIKLFIDINVDDLDDKIKDIEKRRLKAAKKGNEIQLSDIDKFVLDLSIKQSNSELHLKCQGDNFVHINDLEKPDGQHLDSIYLSCEDGNSCRQAMSDWGILAISPTNISEFSSLLVDNGVAIHKNERGDWFSILKNKSPQCNSMIIVDNYILNDIEQIEENLTRLFDAVLPKTLREDNEFHLAVVTTLRKDKKLDLPSKDRLLLLQKLIEKLRSELKVKVSILKNDGSTFHDRTIITNNMWISSGGGFDLYKGHKSTKTTIINILCPFINFATAWGLDAYTKIRSDVRELWNKKPEFKGESFPYFSIGSSENRLME